MPVNVMYTVLFLDVQNETKALRRVELVKVCLWWTNGSGFNLGIASYCRAGQSDLSKGRSIQLHWGGTLWPSPYIARDCSGKPWTSVVCGHCEHIVKYYWPNGLMDVSLASSRFGRHPAVVVLPLWATSSWGALKSSDVRLQRWRMHQWTITSRLAWGWVASRSIDAAHCLKPVDVAVLWSC